MSGSKDKTVKVWNVESRKCVATLEGHSFAVRRAASAFWDTFVMTRLRCRSWALLCFRTGGASFLVGATSSSCGTSRPANAWRRWKGTRGACGAAYVFGTFVMMCLRCRSIALPCFRTGGASCLGRTACSRCGTWRPASAWRRWKGTRATCGARRPLFISTFVMTRLRCRSLALRCFRTGGASCLRRTTTRSSCSHARSKGNQE